jgi:hypothetical protein
MIAGDKIRRFDDVYKLALTLMAVALAFGSRFYESFSENAASLFGLYIVAFAAWSIGHLYEDQQMEVLFKLVGCFGINLVFLPILFDLLVPTRSLVLFFPYAGLAYLIYWQCFRYLREYVRVRAARYLLQYIPLFIIVSTCLLLFVILVTAGVLFFVL